MGPNCKKRHNGTLLFYFGTIKHIFYQFSHEKRESEKERDREVGDMRHGK